MRATEIFFFCLSLVTVCGFRSLVQSQNRQMRLYGDVIQVKFRIHPDGRVEEQVIGIQGSDCTKVTEELNEKLGDVIDSAPTEEMFQEKVQVDDAVTDQVYESKYSEW